MHQFASGWKKSYYGKGDVTAYRLTRQGETAVFGASVLILIYGDAFWPTYTTGDNSRLVATDSMKNFIQRETLNFPGDDLESYCRFLAQKFMDTYPQAEGAQVTCHDVPYAPLAGHAANHPARWTLRPSKAIARGEASPYAAPNETEISDDGKA